MVGRRRLHVHAQNEIYTHRILSLSLFLCYRQIAEIEVQYKAAGGFREVINSILIPLTKRVSRC